MADRQIPFWPRHLSRDMAAAYVGVSVDTFDDEVRKGIWPKGRPRGPKGGRLTWDREVLDAISDRDAGIGQMEEALPPPLDWGGKSGQTGKKRNQGRQAQAA